MRGQRKFRAGIAAAAAFMITVAGCTLGDPEAAGGDDGSGGGGDGGGDGGGGTIIMSTGTVPHLNPQVVVSPSVNQVAGTMLETLVMMKDNYEVVPKLAKDWEFSEDGLSVTLHLQEGVEWHDGEPFTSEDVQFNFEEVMEYQSYGAGLVEVVDSVETPDEHTVVVHLTEQYGPFMQTLTSQYILPKHIYEGTDILTNPANRKPVGTGPFVLEAFREAEEVTVTANPDYWGGDIQPDRLVFPIMTDTNAATLALLAGELDMGGAGQGMMDQIQENPDLEVSTAGSLPQQFIFTMNTKVPELQDPEVRRLVYAAADRQQVSETVLPDNSEVPTSIFPEALAWASDPAVDYREEFAYDVDAINAGLDEAGYPRGDDGTRFTLRVHFMSPLAEVRAAAEVMKASMAQVGINLKLVGEQTNVFTEHVYTDREFDTAIVWSTLGSDPSIGLTRWWACNPEKDAAENPSGVCDEEMQASIDAAMHRTDQEERAEHFRAMQARASELMISAPIVFLLPQDVYNTTRWSGLAGDDLVGIDWTEVAPVE
ncbi:ABC transporter substrate-binding protein [Georgenia halophila]|uniref:ABC transporter substrate-binding protein n=1 Tax=Georgenia halophila TaxID=620889 RepID=A0ABP8KUP5_9MICO